MASGRRNELTKQVGEYLVAAELCRRGFISATFSGNVPEFDILTMDANYLSKAIQVKTIRGPSWQFDATDYLEIEFQGNKQVLRGKSALPYPDLICIFVRLLGQGKDEFYIFRLKDLQELIFKSYDRNLKEKQGIRPKNPKSTHAAIQPNELSKFQDNWRLIEE